MQDRHEIVILGPAQTGKSQLVNRLLGKPFEPEYSGTVGVETKKQPLDKWTVLYRDIASDTDSKLILKQIRTANQIYIVFNVHNADGLLELQEYIQNLKFPEGANITLIGTYTDLGITSSVRDAARLYALDMHAEYLPISLLQDNHLTIQTLLKKTSSLLQRAPIEEKRSSAGSTYSGEGSRRVVPISTVALQKHNDIYAHSIRGGGRNRISAQSIGGGGGCYRTSDSEDSCEQKFESRPTRDMRTPAPASCCSFALLMAGMAMILAALIGLIYIALAVANIISAAALISLMNHMVVSVGSLLGASTATSLMTIGQVGASLNVSTTAVAGMFMTVPSVALLVAGYGAFRAGGQKPAQNTEDNPGPRSR